LKGKEYINEKLGYEGEYLNELKNGKGKEYDYMGNLIYEGDFLKGKRNGNGKEYYVNGKLKFESEYKNGQKNGNGKAYYNSIYSEFTFVGE
jgi:antitoxin component YwqK of YwqJK toxin-antitoxin module